VLFWGIGAAIVFRTVFIFAGSAVIENFSPALIVLGVLLIYGAFKMLLSGGNAVMDTERSMIVRVAKRIIPLSTKIHGDKMFVIQKGKYVATVLFLAVVALEITDILFAIDSMPAAIATVRNPFIEVTSDVAALLCIRSLYFVFEALKANFWLLHRGLFVVLLGIGISLVFEPATVWGIPWFGVVVPIAYSLGFVGVVVAASLVASILVPQPKTLHSSFN
jgi:tellurite resistance protein TerC